MILELDKKLEEKFLLLAKSKDLTPSGLALQLVRDEVEKEKETIDRFKQSLKTAFRGGEDIEHRDLNEEWNGNQFHQPKKPT